MDYQQSSKLFQGPRHVIDLLLNVLTDGRAMIKVVLWLLLAANVRSLPFAWHMRVFRPSFIIWSRYKWAQLWSIFKSSQGKLQAEDRLMDAMASIGIDPFGYTRAYKTWASLDESDWNMHLSNSSYPKVMDAARANATRPAFVMFYRAGGKMALAATHFSFVREIPILASYEVRVSFAAWDHKWIYIVAKFVTMPKGGKLGTKKEYSKSQDRTYHTAVNFPPTPASLSGTTTPASQTPGGVLEGVASSLRALNTGTGSWTEPDGAIVHTVAISQCCFKLGRITVPPSIVFAINGFTAPSVLGEGFLQGSPPSHWPERVKPLMSPLHGGSREKLVKFLSGGWKDIPESERWWEHAMGAGARKNDGRSFTEERRIRGLEVVGNLPNGLSGLRGL